MMEMEGFVPDGSSLPPNGHAASWSDLPSQQAGIAGWAESALAELAALPEVTRVGLAMVEGGGRRLLFTASDRSGWCHVDAFDDVPLNDAIGSGTKLVGPLGDLDSRYQSFTHAQDAERTAAIAAVPLKISGRVLGGFILYYAQPQAFDNTQCRDLDAIADTLAESLHTAIRRPGPTLPDYVRPRGSLVAAQEFPADPASVTHARHFLRATLTAWAVEEQINRDAELCLSELVTNALIHAHSGCCVQVELHQQILRIEVHDAGPGAELSATQADDTHQPHGRGLSLIEALTSRWGQIDGPDRAVVWFAIDLTHAT